jgi:hypothetical protein
MSDDVLKIVPTDFEHVPSEEAQQQAILALEEILPDGEMCEAQSYEHIEFIDCGENLQAIECPKCGARTTLNYSSDEDPGMMLWEQINDRLENTSPSKARVQMPCCSAEVPLTNLQFDWPATFARFELSIYNPNVSENLTPEQLSRLEDILGCKLIQVRAHY